MRKFLIAIVAFMVVMSGVNFYLLRANERTGNPAAAQRRMTAKLEKMAEELNLDGRQQLSIRAAMQTRSDRIECAMNEYDDSVRSVLSPAQLQAYAALSDRGKKTRPSPTE